MENKSAITREMLAEDAKRNGVAHMQADVAEARKTGVRLTPEAEEYLTKTLTA